MRRWIAILLAACAGCCAACATVGEAPVSSPASGATSARPRLLFISLDAVPYGVVERVMDPGQGEGAAFRGFAGPAGLISTFPSTTSLALGGILAPFGLDRSPGYEHRFFDRARNRKRGGGPISYRRLRFPWRRFFDWQLEGLASKGIKLLHLQKSAQKAVDTSLAAFAASDQEVYHLYHDLTDLIGHVKGPDALEPFLRHLDAGLERLRSRDGARPFHTVIYSDHGLSGGEPLRNVRKGVKKALRRAGFRIAGRIRGSGDAVFIPYGLVSSFVAFTAPDREAAVAGVLASVDGVDLCVAPVGEGWRVASARGDARIARRNGVRGDEYAYRPLSGDPLGYGELGDGGEPGAFAPDAWWLEATASAPYPDALYRVVQGFELVENPASIICSVAEGHMYGSAYTVLGSRISTGRLRWTHGALSSEASLGFVISDAPDWQAPERVRFDQALVPWGTAGSTERRARRDLPP